MKYIVVHSFKDLQDNDHIYKVGDYYPREDVNIEDIDKERIEELAGVKNKIGKILIKEVEVPELEADGEKEPEVEPDGEKEPEVETDGEKEPEVETDGEKEPEVEPDGEKELESDGKSKTNKKTKINKKRCENG